MIVLAVDPGSQGEAMGFRPRDVIVGVEKDVQTTFQPIADIATLQRILARHAGRDLDMVIMRNQAPIVLRWRDVRFVVSWWRGWGRYNVHHGSRDWCRCGRVFSFGFFCHTT